MKQYLKQSVGFAVLCAAFMSCSKSTDLYDPDIHEKEAKSAYVEHFENFIGGSVNSNVDWGFGRSARSSTRSDQGWEIGSDYLQEYQKGFMQEVIEILPEGQEVKETTTVKRNYEFKTDDGFYFEFIFSNTKENIEIGYYFYNPEEGIDKRTEKTVTDHWVESLASVEYFRIVSTTGQKYVPESDWGAKLWENGVGEKLEAKHVHVTLDDMPAGSIFGFYFKSGDKKVYTNQYLNPDNQSFFSLIDIPRTERNTYLGSSYIIGMEDTTSSSTDFDCNDVIISMTKESIVGTVPEEPEVEPEPEPLTWYRIIGEDVIVHDKNWDIDESETDFDFNDIVLDVAMTKDASGQDVLKCILRAAGGTLPIRINGDESLEVHKLFGVSQSTMVNTNAESKGMSGATKDPVEFEIKKSFSSAKDVKIEVYKNSNTGWVEFQAPMGVAAAKICVDTDFKWPDEKVSLKQAYPNFPKYATTNAPTKWW